MNISLLRRNYKKYYGIYEDDIFELPSNYEFKYYHTCNERRMCKYCKFNFYMLFSDFITILNKEEIVALIRKFPNGLPIYAYDYIRNMFDLRDSQISNVTCYLCRINDTAIRIFNTDICYGCLEWQCDNDEYDAYTKVKFLNIV